eukprot:GHVT01008129.1.p1 GENE.GHVT01008129.1~~GHVT01008129.1.p1  ORF type:complete len:104 (+),score=21.45 GHVT01008129.1:585-896(+)
MHPSKIPPQLYHPPPKSRFGVDVADPGERQTWPGTQFLVGARRGVSPRPEEGQASGQATINESQKETTAKDGRLGRGSSGHPLAGESVENRGDEWRTTQNLRR